MLWLALKLVFFARPPGLQNVIKPDHIGCDIKIQNHMKRLDGEMKPCVIYVFWLACVCSIYYIGRKGGSEQKPTTGSNKIFYIRDVWIHFELISHDLLHIIYLN